MAMMAQNPNDIEDQIEQAYKMAAPVAAYAAPVDPHAALTVPIGPPAPKPMTMAAGPSGSPKMSAHTNELGDALPEATGSQEPSPKMANADDAIKEHLNNKLMADYQKDSDPYGSADNHPGFFGKLLHGLSVATGGPGRREFEEEGGTTRSGHQVQGLEGKLQNIGKEESEENLQGAETTGKSLENDNEPQKAADTHAQSGATTANLESETRDRDAAASSPSFEVHDTDAGPLLINKKDGTAQHLTLDGAPVGEKVKLTYQTVDGPDGKPHVYGMDDKGNRVVDLGEHYERPTVSVNAGEKNLWSVPQPDGTQRVISLKSGDTIPKGAVSLSGQNSENLKSGAADAPTQSALKFANDYLSSGAFTGPSDEALQDQFFQLAKPSTGFRMNQAQIDQLHNMASWMDSMKGRLYHTMNGVWFAPEQRQQIVKTMNDLAKSKGIGTESGGGNSAPMVQHSPSTGQYRYSTDGGKTWQAGQPSQQK